MTHAGQGGPKLTRCADRRMGRASMDVPGSGSSKLIHLFFDLFLTEAMHQFLSSAYNAVGIAGVCSLNMNL